MSSCRTQNVSSSMSNSVFSKNSIILLKKMIAASVNCLTRIRASNSSPPFLA